MSILNVNEWVTFVGENSQLNLRAVVGPGGKRQFTDLQQCGEVDQCQIKIVEHEYHKLFSIFFLGFFLFLP